MEESTVIYFDKTLRFYRKPNGNLEFNTKDFCEILGKSSTEILPSGFVETIQFPYAMQNAYEFNYSFYVFLKSKFG